MRMDREKELKLQVMKGDSYGWYNKMLISDNLYIPVHTFRYIPTENVRLFLYPPMKFMDY
jgi:hypothetical protein